MDASDFQRARSPQAKQQREDGILAAARSLGAERGIRQITLTDIADAVGMHKSAMLRYFETREQIFLRLTAEGWREWSEVLRVKLERIGSADREECGVRLLHHTGRPRHVLRPARPGAARTWNETFPWKPSATFKLVTHDEVDAIVAVMRRLLPGLTERDCIDVLATATSLSGAFWQMANPAPEVATLYRSDPRMSHADFEVEPRVRRILTAMLKGTLGA